MKFMARMEADGLRGWHGSAGGFAKSETLFRDFVDGAYLLADVTAEDKITHEGAQFEGDTAPEFDGEVGDAARVVEDVGRR